MDPAHSLLRHIAMFSCLGLADLVAKTAVAFAHELAKAFLNVAQKFATALAIALEE